MHARIACVLLHVCVTRAQKKGRGTLRYLALCCSYIAKHDATVSRIMPYMNTPINARMFTFSHFFALSFVTLRAGVPLGSAFALAGVSTSRLPSFAFIISASFTTLSLGGGTSSFPCPVGFSLMPSALYSEVNGGRNASQQCSVLGPCTSLRNASKIPLATVRLSAAFELSR